MTQEQKDRIDREARNKFQYGGLILTQSKREGYIAGATAEVERAQELVNALEWIKTYGPVDDLTKKFIDNALLKWEGNIITDPCPHCGKELQRDRNLCCRECGKEVKNKICICSDAFLAAHGECYNCPGKHTKVNNPT